jgi:hypothetical protein
MVDAVDEQGAVGELGQRVVERPVGELLLQRRPLGDVPGVQHQLTNPGIRGEVGAAASWIGFWMERGEGNDTKEG